MQFQRPIAPLACLKSCVFRTVFKISSQKRKPGFGAALVAKMTASTATSFVKAPSCPSSNILLSFRMNNLSPEILSLIKYHVYDCEFCQAELLLLAHYKPPAKGECKAPEIPINLRILAESLLGKSARERRKSDKESMKYGLVAEG